MFKLFSPQELPADYTDLTSTVSSVSSSGLPYRLPDTVRPAAVLQHVLRPPQPSRETNPSVYRPLAPPSAAPAHHLPSSAPSHDPHNEFTAKEKEKLIKEEGDGVGRDSCTCPVTSFL